MPRILFVCTGNICRSPMAESILRKRLGAEGLLDWHVESAGTWTRDDVPASYLGVQLMAKRGIDISMHRSRAVNRDILAQADLVLVMTQNHAEALCLEFPDQCEKVYLLSEMKDGHRYDIDDPYGGSVVEYRSCVKTLTNLIEAGFDRIKSLAEANASARSDTA